MGVRMNSMSFMMMTRRAAVQICNGSSEAVVNYERPR